MGPHRGPNSLSVIPGGPVGGIRTGDARICARSVTKTPRTSQIHDGRSDVWSLRAAIAMKSDQTSRRALWKRDFVSSSLRNPHVPNGRGTPEPSASDVGVSQASEDLDGGAD